MGPLKPINLTPQTAGSEPPVAGGGVFKFIASLPTFSFVKPGEDVPPLLPAAGSRYSPWMAEQPTHARALRQFEWPEGDRHYRRRPDLLVQLSPASIIFLLTLGSHPDYFPPSLSAKGFTPRPPTGKKTDVYPGMQVGIARAMEGLPDDLFLAKSYFLRDSSWGATPARVRDFIASPLGQEALEKPKKSLLFIKRYNLRFLEAWLKFRFPKWSDKKLGEFLAKRELERESVRAKWIADAFGTGAMGTSFATFLNEPFPYQGK